jgi:prepilin-type processing-associated H-X9-DG protein
MPWSLVKSSFQLYPGPLARTKLKNASTLSLVWDAHTTMITFNGTTSVPVDKPFVYYRDNTWPLSQLVNPTSVTGSIWRHSKFSTRDGRGRGPNVLFADGHCEPTVNIYSWTDDNVSLRGNVSN